MAECQRAQKEMTPAFFYRITAWIFLAIVVAFGILTGLSATIGAERLNNLALNHPSITVLLGTIGAIGAFSIVALWIGMMSNCLSVSDLSLTSKIAWFLLILFTNMLGALIYYFVIYRREEHGVQSSVVPY